MRISITGKVVHGLHQGRELGYPTANLAYNAVAASSLSPGVYVGRVYGIFSDDRQRGAIAAIVVGADFKDEPPLKLEAYILDFQDDLYGQEVTFVLLEKIRELQRFDTIDALKERIQQDIDTIILKGTPI